MAIPAVLSGIGGILDIIGSAKRLHDGGRLRKHYKLKKGGAAQHGVRHAVYKRRHVVHHRKHKVGGRVHKRKHKHMRKHRGKGVLADIVGKIPLLGSLAGPLISMLGGRIRHRKHTKKTHRTPRGRGLAPMYQYRPYVGGRLRRRKHPRKHKKARGRGLAPMYQYKPYLGGMLMPSGGPTMPHGYRGGVLSLPGAHLMPGGYHPAPRWALLSNKATITPYMPPKPPGPGMIMSALSAVKGFLDNAKTGDGLHRRRRHVKKHRGGKIHHRKHKAHRGRGAHVIKLPLIGNVAASMVPKFLHGLARGGLLAPAGGLLHPAGGAVHRRGHMRKIPGRAAKVHVRATVARKGGYMPYRW